MPNFRRYSAYYDLLYRDKDYAAEAEYVARLIRSTLPEARRILELGSGTGRHGCLLAAMGFERVKRGGVVRYRGVGLTRLN